MHRLYASICTLFLIISSLHAQNGCPGCTINLPSMPADTLYIGPLPDGEQWQPYDNNISFRLPKTTTPVNAVDTTTPPGLPITKFEVVGLEGLPPGLDWTPSQWVFETANQTDGCFRICGTPTSSDTFVLTVRLRATVFFIVQEASFPLKLYIAPPTLANDGFTMSNYTGCGELTVNFTNNIPSGGDPGFTYEWDFGDGDTFEGENPPPHTYTAPGMYPVQYHVTIDTVGYILQSVSVLSVDCNDPLGGSPDLYLVINNPSGLSIYNSSPAVNNTLLPWNLPLGLPLENGNYTVQVWDEDAGIKGSDDPCGSIPFNVLSGDTLVSGAYRIVLNIERPVFEFSFIDTVTVYFQPSPPVVNAPEGLSACEGGDLLLLVSSYGAGNQWWYEGEAVQGATEFIYEPQASGYYHVEVTTVDGCSAISDSILITYHPIPAEPLVTPLTDLSGCTGADSVYLNSSYSSGNQQWRRNGFALSGAGGASYAAVQSGFYQVQYTSPEGCSAVSDSVQVTFFAVPPAPVITPLDDLAGCAGADSVWLNSNYATGNQWWLNGAPLPGAAAPLLAALQSGTYRVQYTSPQGCASVSSPVQVTFTPTPAIPAFTNTNNLLRLTDTLALPANYSLQWYLNGVAIPNANGFTYCATLSGNFSLEVVNLDTDCAGIFALNVVFNPAFDCTVGTQEGITQALRLFPNPAASWVELQLEQAVAKEALLTVWDITGRVLYQNTILEGQDRFQVDCSAWPQGFYLLEIRAADERIVGKLTVQR